jgi:hypothetical protein
VKPSGKAVTNTLWKESTIQIYFKTLDIQPDMGYNVYNSGKVTNC